MTKKIFFIFILVFFLFLSLAPSAFAWSFKDLPGFYGKTATEAGLTQADPTAIVAKVISTVLLLTGAIFVILVIYAGFTWMTSTGSEDKIKKAKNILTYSVISLFIIVTAYSITSFIATTIPSGTPIQPTTPGSTSTTPGQTTTQNPSTNCINAGGVCASYDDCTRTLQGTIMTGLDCGTLACCQKPTTTQNCRQCGAGLTNSCNREACESLGCNCKFTIPWLCDYTPGYRNSTCQ